MAAPDPTLAIQDWLIRQGLESASQEALLEGYCERIAAAGIPVMRVHVAQRAFHPQFGGIGFDWRRTEGAEREHYEHADQPRADWLNSPLRHLLSEDIAEMRERLPADGPPSRFPFLNILRERGGRDYFAAKLTFDLQPVSLAVDPNNPPEGVVISWTSDAEEGFSDADIAMLRALLPPLGLALKSAANRQMARDVAATYLGADAGQRVLSGEIQRGSFESVQAVIWYFDLQGFTKLSERIEGPATIAMLNAYFGEVVAAVERHGGNVLKFMGDGLLAIFDYGRQDAPVDAALTAAQELRDAIDRVNVERAAEGLPVTDFSLALHGGDVLYGNIGGEARLDFTVIGPAVNATARILGMCGPLERRLIISSEIAGSARKRKDDVVSLGRYLLRGVSAPQELFTLYRSPGD